MADDTDPDTAASSNQEALARIQAIIDHDLDPDNLNSCLMRAADDVSVPPADDPPMAATDAAADATPMDGGDAGAPPPRPATLGDFIRALLAFQPVKDIVNRLKQQASAQVRRDLGRLTAGETVLVVTDLVTIAGVGAWGLTRDAKAAKIVQDLALGPLNDGVGRLVPGLKVNLDIVGPNKQFGLQWTAHF